MKSTSETITLTGHRLTAALFCSAFAFLQACSTTDTRAADTEAVRDYIVAAELEETDLIRTRVIANPRISPINEYFLVYETRDEHFLVEMRSRCYELFDNTRITPDVRRDSTTIRARFDTIRGCLIDRIYTVDAAQAIELKQLGDAPGDDDAGGEEMAPDNDG